MNSNKILTAYKENEDKFKIITDLSEELTNIIHNKNRLFSDINNIFQVVFKNFSTERIKTNIKIKNMYFMEYEDKGHYDSVFINRDGISVRAYSDDDGSTTNIFCYATNNFIGYLKALKEKELEIMQHIKKQNKQDIFHLFLEDVDLLEVDRKFKKEINLKFWEKEKIKSVTKLLIKPSEVEFKDEKDTDEYKYNNDRISISRGNMSLSDKIIIEQIFDELNTILIEYLDKEKIALSNAQIFLDNLKTKFSNQLIIYKLKQK